MALADMYVEGIYEMWGVLHPVYMPLITGDQQKFVITHYCVMRTL